MMKIPTKKVALAFFLGSLFLLFGITISYASLTTWTQTSQSDFQSGTIDSNVDEKVSPGDLKLAETLNTTTYTLKYDFDLGTNIDLETTNTDTGEVELSLFFFTYSTTSTPAIPNKKVRHSWLDPVTNYLYISTSGGLSVIDTKGTIITSDDTLVITYSTASTPAIAFNSVFHSWLDTASNYLYISASGGGLSVIDTKGTTTPSDDTLVVTYSTASTPAIPDNSAVHSWLDSTTDLLYISIANSGGGLSVIDTKGTTTPSDDTLEITYSTASTPAIVDNRVHRSWLDATTNYLYLNTSGGLSVIDTKGTAVTSDDTLVITYSTASTPAIASNDARHSFLDFATNYLYISTYGGGLSVIDTKGTAVTSDDTLVITYSTASTPAISHNQVLHSWLDATTNYLYISNDVGGLSVIDTKGTTTPSDDTLAITYSTTSTPAIAGDTGIHSWLDATTNYLYISTFDGLSIVSLSRYMFGGSYSGVISSSPLPRVVSWEATTPANTSISVQTRSGDSTVFWKDDFDDGDVSNVDDGTIISNDWAYGGIITSISEAGGILTLADPIDSGFGGDANDAYPQIIANSTADYFPAGATVTARIRMTASDPTAGVWMITDEWEDGDSGEFNTKDEWSMISFSPTEDFSKVGFEMWEFDSPGDKLEIDWITIELPDSAPGWSAWSSAYTSQYGSVITSDTSEPWLKYRVDLSTSDGIVTPSLNSITFASGYPSSGTYTSEVKDFGDQVHLRNLSWSKDVPSGTSLTFKVRSGDPQSPTIGWSSWQTLSSSGEGIPPQLTPARYFQYQLVFSTGNSAATPTLSSVSLAYDLDISPPSLSLKKLGTLDFNPRYQLWYYTGRQPLFQGKTDPFATIKITIASDPIVGTTQADSSGNWSWSPSQPLPYGEHLVTLLSTDPAGNTTEDSFTLNIVASLDDVPSQYLPQAEEEGEQISQGEAEEEGEEEGEAEDQPSAVLPPTEEAEPSEPPFISPWLIPLPILLILIVFFWRRKVFA